MSQKLLTDVFQWYGGDVGLGPTGDLQQVSGTVRTQQRIVRRLCTNPGDYIFHPEYGGGLPGKIGSNASTAEIKAIVQAQVALEASVATQPKPVVTVSPIGNGAMRIVIQYTDAQTRAPVLLSFDVNS